RDEAVDRETPLLGAASNEHLSAQLVDGPARDHTRGDPAIEDTMNGREEPLAARWRREICGFFRRQPHVVRPRGALDVREARWPKWRRAGDGSLESAEQRSRGVDRSGLVAKGRLGRARDVVTLLLQLCFGLRHIERKR